METGQSVQRLASCFKAAAITGGTNAADIVESAKYYYTETALNNSLPVEIQTETDETVMFDAFIQSAAHFIVQTEPANKESFLRALGVMDFCDELVAEAERQKAIVYARPLR